MAKKKMTEDEVEEVHIEKAEESIKNNSEDIKEEIIEEEVREPQLSDLPGVGPATISKLEDAGITDMIGIAVLTPKLLNEKTGMSEAVSRKVIQAAMSLAKLDFKPGLEYELTGVVGFDEELQQNYLDVYSFKFTNTPPFWILKMN